MTVSVAELAADPDGFLKRAHTGRCPFAHTDLGPMALTHDAVRGLVQNRKLRPAFSKVLELTGVHGGVFYDWMSRSALMRPPTNRVQTAWHICKTHSASDMTYTGRLA